MHSLLEQLENNEAVLLMYIAGELPAEDRVEVEQMLSTDAQLRQDLKDLRAALDASATLVASADAKARLPVKVEVAVGKTLRSMRQWRLARPGGVPVVEPNRTGLTYPWWVYPTSAAAMVLLAAVVWWGFHNEPNTSDFNLRATNAPFMIDNGDGSDIVDDQIDGALYALAADPLDQAYLELRSIQELGDGM
jgi:anti-sigma factor RsiW